jgi:hypothetical protein
VKQTINAAELAARVRAQGLRCTTEQAAAWLAEWTTRRLVMESPPGRYRLTDSGWATAGGLLEAQREERAA